MTWIRSKKKIIGPWNLPRVSNDFALRKTASRSKLTAWIDIGGTGSLCERRLLVSDLLDMDTFILGITAAISIPSNTWSAACVLPFWYSSLPNNALASYENWKVFQLQTISKIKYWVLGPLCLLDVELKKLHVFQHNNEISNTEIL